MCQDGRLGLVGDPLIDGVWWSLAVLDFKPRLPRCWEVVRDKIVCVRGLKDQ